MYGTVTWSGLLGLIALVVIWETVFAEGSRTNRRLNRWFGPRPKQKGLMPPGGGRRVRVPR